MKNLNNKTIWITGASSGIGEALSQELAKRGATVILSGRNKDKLNQVKKACKKTPPKQANHLVLPFDICNPKEVKQAHKLAKKHTGRIDWLINNAGISQRALIMETTEEVERQLMEVDYFAQTRLTRLVLPTMIEQGGGKVVMMSSIAGLLGTQYRSVYGAAKAAIHMWANSLRAELYEQGIEVATVFPGFVQTNISINALMGDGSTQGTMDGATDRGLTAKECAKLTSKALIKGKEYIVITDPKEQLASLLNGVSPHKLYKIIREMKVT